MYTQSQKSRKIEWSSNGASRGTGGNAKAALAYKTVLVLCLFTINVQSASVASGHSRSIKGRKSVLEDTEVPRKFIIETEEDAKKLAELHATKKKEVMFTTHTNAGKEFTNERKSIVLHSWESLRAIGRMNNAMLITYEEHTCQALWREGIPCILDRYLTQPADLPGWYRVTPHYYQKHTWALKLVSWGYQTTFFEFDQVFFKDPLPYFHPDIDIQGLSDWRFPVVPPAAVRFSQTCDLYHMEKDPVTNETMLGNGPADPGELGSQPARVPCMSTGFWTLKPTKLVVEYLEFLTELMLQRNYMNEQPLWNEAIGTHLIGQQGKPPISFSLLDEVHFSNFEVYEWRVEQNMTVDPVVIHAGYLWGITEKIGRIKHHKFWRADAWEKTTAARSIYQLYKDNEPDTNPDTDSS